MRIGLDIDNVILDTDFALLNAFKKEDVKKRNKGIINYNADYIMSGMFDWSKDEITDFLNNNMEMISTSLQPLKDAKKYMDLLLEEGNELYLISNRSYPQYKCPMKTTVENLKKNKINYTRLILTDTNDKSVEVLENSIDIFVDDRPTNCFILKNYNINCILFKTIYEKRNFSNLYSVSNWEELYKMIKNMNEVIK